MKFFNKQITSSSLIIGFLILLIILYLQLNKPLVETINQNIIEADWHTYRNEDLGLEFRYPGRIFIQDGACKFMEGNYRTLYAPVETKILAKDSIIYIGRAYNYDIDDQGCVKKDNDLTQDYLALKIIIKSNIFNNQDLNKLVEEFYGGAGDQCRINEKNEASQVGVYDIIVRSDGKEWEDSRCFIDSQTYLKYYPEKNKIMFTDLGMEYRFFGNASSTITFDQAIIDSFKFIN